MRIRITPLNKMYEGHKNIREWLDRVEDSLNERIAQEHWANMMRQTESEIDNMVDDFIDEIDKEDEDED